MCYTNDLGIREVVDKLWKSNLKNKLLVLIYSKEVIK